MSKDFLRYHKKDQYPLLKKAYIYTSYLLHNFHDDPDWCS
ncbi:hypothetical protein CRE_17047 [Caenorhabditis remanei]|uniref:Uncharacterized protein n=1 Tax=Caenorhabditis remanei TaxID=31234 RepID=E3M9W2_CAERE|nr:hypothetical protein CRE_17047 [Caenorhabditis remanei]